MTDTGEPPRHGESGPRRVPLAIEAQVRHVTRMTHVANVGGFEFHSDEPPSIEGDDEYPYPLHYFVAGIGMCVLTQVIRFARVLKVDVDDASVAVTLDWSSSGSALQGTIATTAEGLHIDIDVDSKDEPERVAALIQTARDACYAEAAIRAAVPIVADATLNGEAFRYEDHPKKVSRRARTATAQEG